MKTLVLSLAAAALPLAGACSRGGPAAAPSPASAAQPPSAGSAEPVSLKYKDERKRLAMRGLSYQSGRAVVVPEEARLVVAGGDHAQAEAERARGEDLLARNYVIEAIEAFTRSVLLAPEVPAHYAGLGRAFLGKRMVPEATAAFRTGLDLDPASLELRFLLADALSRAGDREAAIVEFRAVVEADPSHAKARERLALQLYYAGDPASAWAEVHAAEALGHAVPPQFRALLAQASPEPVR